MRWLSLCDLSPLSNIPKDHLFVAFKSYFDGGNKADSQQYKTVTLASFSGTSVKWQHFERKWAAVLVKHNAPWLHTTDAVSLNKPFSKSSGWSKDKVDEFYQ